jgi:hypothetical protein
MEGEKEMIFDMAHKSLFGQQQRPARNPICQVRNAPWLFLACPAHSVGFVATTSPAKMWCLT